MKQQRGHNRCSRPVPLFRYFVQLCGKVIIQQTPFECVVTKLCQAKPCNALKRTGSKLTYCTVLVAKRHKMGLAERLGETPAFLSIPCLRQSAYLVVKGSPCIGAVPQATRTKYSALVPRLLYKPYGPH